ncbi:hypothetical protein AAZX31_16G167200 [Glycine max]|uniref:Receptor-like protein EIX2 n=1 Tax=Glycine soja TaxID=3848 RepID=A0A445GKB3_GLYSO|nr:Receptor-like protein EIX2 [Glycine soja]
MNSSSIIYILVFVQLWLLSLPCRESVCIPSERETLLKIKNNLNDSSNRLWSWNHNNTNCCHWYGVLCHNLTSHVLQLHLHTTPPASFDDWEAFRRWSFGGEISPCLADLKHLNYLDLSANVFLGEGIKSPSWDCLFPYQVAFMGSLPQFNSLFDFLSTCINVNNISISNKYINYVM